jgi:hypothetical protein
MAKFRDIAEAASPRGSDRSTRQHIKIVKSPSVAGSRRSAAAVPDEAHILGLKQDTVMILLLRIEN